MAVDYYSLKIASEKVELIQETLGKIDEAVALVSAFTTADENKELIAKLIENIDDVKQIVGSVDLMETTTDDINKGTYLGSRKLDIDLSLNKTGIAETLTYEAAMAIWTTTTNTVYYNKATCTFVDGTVIVVNFINDDLQPIQVSTHGAIIDQLNSNTAFTAKLENTAILEEVGGRVGTIIRIVDVTGHSSNIERIQLHATTGAYVSAEPIHFWALTTSALQTLANRVGDIIALGNDIDKIIVLSSRIDEMMELQNNLTKLLNIHADLSEILQADTMAQVATEKAGIATTQAGIASAQAGIATTKASEAANSATLATQKANEIKTISVEQTITGASGTNASVIYNPTTGKFTFVVPQGLKGDRGESFTVNAQDIFANRTLYDNQPKGFSFLALDVSLVYFKNSSTLGDWGVGAPFGRGDKGDQGVSITGIVRTTGNGSAGTTDIYTIYYNDATEDTFSVYNGANGAVMSVAGKSGDVVLAKADVGLGNVDNTSDANKPVSTATQSALDLKANITSLSTKQDTLVSGTNIKTINGSSVLGSGNVDLSAITPMAFFDTETILSSKTWTCPKDGTYCFLVVGAGGSGANFKGTTNGCITTGGGSGGLVAHRVTLAQGAQVNITIGARGSIVLPLAETAQSGNAGGNTVVILGGTTLTAGGGGGGFASTSLQYSTGTVNGGAGGSASGGNIANLTGGAGGSVFKTTGFGFSQCATGGGGVPLKSGATTRGGNITLSITTERTSLAIATGGGGAYNRGSDITFDSANTWNSSAGTRGASTHEEPYDCLNSNFSEGAGAYNYGALTQTVSPFCTLWGGGGFYSQNSTTNYTPPIPYGFYGAGTGGSGREPQLLYSVSVGRYAHAFGGLGGLAGAPLSYELTNHYYNGVGVGAGSGGVCSGGTYGSASYAGGQGAVFIIKE